MQNYKETQINGTQHTRCKKLELLNPLEDRQVVIFHEETVFQLTDDERISRSDGTLTIVVDPSKEVEHYETGEKMTYAEMHKWLASFYLSEALERDALAEANSSAGDGETDD